jgi:hypothetical protein
VTLSDASVRIPALRIGAEAAERLIDMIVSEDAPEQSGGGGRAFPVELGERATTGAPPWVPQPPRGTEPSPCRQSRLTAAVPPASNASAGRPEGAIGSIPMDGGPAPGPTGTMIADDGRPARRR